MKEKEPNIDERQLKMLQNIFQRVCRQVRHFQV